jgi:hypothetical protein
MPIPVRLQGVVDQMQMGGDEVVILLNRKTGEFVSVSDEERRRVEEGDGADWAEAPAWQRELLPKVKEAMESSDYVELPDQFDIHEWSIMERFCSSVEDAGHRDALFDSIHGSGAFRRFKDTLGHFGIEKDWYAHRDRALESIAVDWLEAEGIPFSREAEG